MMTEKLKAKAKGILAQVKREYIENMLVTF